MVLNGNTHGKIDVRVKSCAWNYKFIFFLFRSLSDPGPYHVRVCLEFHNLERKPVPDKDFDT
jgi:hypothetical protein